MSSLFQGVTDAADAGGRMTDVEHLDGDVYCLMHGKPLLDGMYGSKASNCEECEPPEPDYDGAAEMHARRTDPTHPANVEMARLKSR